MEEKHLLHYTTHQNSRNSEWLLLIHGAGKHKDMVETDRRSWKNYNLLLVDLPGHGENQHSTSLFPEYSFPFIGQKVWEIVDYLVIYKLHVAGVSLGTIICLQMRELQPERFLSIIMPGAIVQLNRKLKVLARISLASAKIIGYEITR